MTVMPILLLALWSVMPPTIDGSEKDFRLFLAVLAVPISPCLATMVIGTWNIRRFVQLRREFSGLDMLSLLSVVCLAGLLTLAADYSVEDFKPHLEKPPTQTSAIGKASP